MALEEFAIRLLTVIVEAIGLDGLNAILNKHPLTAGKIIATERAASDTALDALEADKLRAVLKEGEGKP